MNCATSASIKAISSCLVTSRKMALGLAFSFSPSIQLSSPCMFCSKSTVRNRTLSISAIHDDSQTTNQQGQLNLSVLRFTLGIPGFDESYLPRWIGYGFGSLLLLNHFVGSDVSTITPAQLRTEALGLSLAAFSITLPYLGKFLPGAAPVTQASIPKDNEQLFIMSEDFSDSLRENLAWSTYVLLRNTNTTAALISVDGELCVRGYWSVPDNVPKAGWFQKQIENTGLFDLKGGVLYFPQNAASEFSNLLPKGTSSLLVQPLSQATEKSRGFIILASSMSYAYSNKDRAWIEAIAAKF